MTEEDITVTDKAVEEIKKLFEKKGYSTENSFLRLGVKGGGCSGYSYVLLVDEDLDTGHDQVFDKGGVRVVVDSKSMLFLKGTTLDYETKLMEHGFKIRNPNETKRCSCGNSFGA